MMIALWLIVIQLAILNFNISSIADKIKDNDTK